MTLGGVDLRALPVDALMRRVACVFQDVALLDDTVAANLKLGRPDAGDEEMMLAASAAGAHAFISACPPATKRSSATAACTSRAANGSGCRSRAR